MKERKESQQAIPFFARFLESQEFPRVQTDVKGGPGNDWSHNGGGSGGGRGYVTMKYPSDDDEGVEI